MSYSRGATLQYRFRYGLMIARFREQLALKVSEFVYRVKIWCRFKAVSNEADNLLSEQFMAMNLKLWKLNERRANFSKQ